MRLLAIALLLLAWPSVASAQLFTCRDYLDIYDAGEMGEGAGALYVRGFSDGLEIGEAIVVAVDSKADVDNSAAAEALAEVTRPLLGLSFQEIATRTALRCRRGSGDRMVYKALVEVIAELRAVP